MPAATPTLMVPKVGQVLTVYLPSEITRAEVTEVLGEDTIMARLVMWLMAKTHHHKMDDVVKCSRVRGVLGERWEVA